jgi:iron complex transport system ATP-binding protein
MLRASSISYRVGHKQILSDVSAEFRAGEFNMILGPNGSGKSTFLKIFSGDLSAEKGEVHYEDRSIRTISKEGLARQRAVMSQHAELNFPLAVEEVIMMGRYPHFNFVPSRKDHQICEEVMKRMDLITFRERNYLTLSGGEKQRVQFARVLTQIWEAPPEGTRYLMLDEPLSSLDINYQHEFLRLAEEFLKKDTVLIAILHDINLAIQYAQRLFFLKDGRLVAEGKPASVLTEELIEKVFGIKASIVPNPLNSSPLVLFEK